MISILFNKVTTIDGSLSAVSIKNITPTGNGKIVTLNFNELIKEQLSYFIIAISFKNIMFVSATSNPMKREATPFAVNNRHGGS